MHAVYIDIGAHLARETSQPKHVEGKNTAEGSVDPTTSPSPIKGIYISKKKRYKLAAAAASGNSLTVPHKTNANNAKDKKNEFNQEDTLRDMGITSLELVDSEQFGLIDPTLGDWACQLRVLWLIDFANKYKTLKTTQSSELTREKLRGKNPVISAKELEMLGMYRFSTLFTSFNVDRLGMRKTVRTRARGTTPEENARLEGVEMATFSTVVGSSGKRVYVRDKEARHSDQLGMIIHMFSCFHAASNAAIETNLDADTFFVNARHLAFDEFNAGYDGIVALHPQHPPQTYIRGPHGKFLTDEVGKPLELLHKPQGVPIDATPVLRRMREHAAGFALAHGIGQGAYYTAATGPEKKPAGKHFDKSIPLHIEHIHVASSNGAALQMRKYTGKYGKVVIPADAAVTETIIANAGYKTQTTGTGIFEYNSLL